MNFDTLTPNQKLDEILRFLNGKPYQPIHAICYNFYGNEPKVVADKLPEVNQILAFLFDERYITESGMDYRLTFLGSVFIQDGGYIYQETRRVADKKRLEATEKQTRWLAFWVAFGTVGLLAFEIVKFVLEHCFCY